LATITAAITTVTRPTSRARSRFLEGLSADAEVEVGKPVRVLLSIDVADVDALLPRVQALGGSAPGPANDMPWGQRVAHITDPDGTVVNLTQQL
jgi:predicted enzyme related to lactoylglutathione lyase